MRKTLRVTDVILCMFLIISGSFFVNAAGVAGADQTSYQEDDSFVVGIAWTDEPSKYSIQCMYTVAEEFGESYQKLDMVRSYDLSYDEEGILIDGKNEQGMLLPDAAKPVKINTWLNSDVEEVMDGIDCIIFPGGKDIIPTLYYDVELMWQDLASQPGQTAEEQAPVYSAERDVSDFILMSYCLEHDIPILAICRGMQMLSVYSGASMIQDLGIWYASQNIEYHNEHRDPEEKDLVPHPVDILTEDSLLYEIIGVKTLEGCPSWHHQAVLDVTDTRLTVTAQTMTDGLPVIEAVERDDRTFCLGVQFHPEVAAAKAINQEANAGNFMDYETAMSLFYSLIECGKAKIQQIPPELAA